MDLSKNQYKLLKKINHLKTVRYDSLSPTELESCGLLYCEGFVLQFGVGHDGIDPDHYEIQVTEYGKMYIATRQRDNIKFIIPVTVSIIAIIISILALYKTSQPIYINISSASITASTASATIPT